MPQKKALSGKRLLAVAAMATLAPLTLAACGGGGSSSGGSGASSSAAVDSLTVMDYYTNEPNHTQIGDQLSKCGTSIGVAKVDHQSVPGPTLIQKVLQQASSKSLPDVLMLDNPDIQQIAATGALAPLGDYGINADGYAPGPVAAATYNGQLYGLQPGANTLALFYNKDVLDKAGREAADDVGRAQGGRLEADRGQAVRVRIQRDRRLRGCLAVPPADVDQRR